MNAAGVRGVRFNFVKRLIEVTPRELFLHRRTGAAARRHIVVYFEAPDLADLTPFLKGLQVGVVVVDHMGRLMSQGLSRQISACLLI